MAPGILNPFIKFPSGAGAVGGWVELGRTTLGSAASTITVSSLPNKRYYQILYSDKSINSTGADIFVRFNSDTGSNYAIRRNKDGGSEATGVNQTLAYVYAGNTVQTPNFLNLYVANLSANEKLLTGHGVSQLASGAGNAPQRVEHVAKWVNTADPIDEVTFLPSAGSFATGSEVVVLGWDPADVHTTNFWDELASADLSGGVADTISSGVFTSKKYLWVQCFLESSGTVQDGFRVGNTTVDTGTNYASRQSVNGLSDTTTTSVDDIGDFSNIGANQFMNMFIVNNASNEKLIMYNIIAPGSTGSGTAPTRLEVIGKWANTSDQIDVLEWRNVAGGGDYGTKTILKVWGSN